MWQRSFSPQQMSIEEAQVVDTANGGSNPTMGASRMIKEHLMQGLSTELDESNNPYDFGNHFLPDVESWPKGWV